MIDSRFFREDSKRVFWGFWAGTNEWWDEVSHGNILTMWVPCKEKSEEKASVMMCSWIVRRQEWLQYGREHQELMLAGQDSDPVVPCMLELGIWILLSVRWKPQNSSELQSDVVCVVTQPPVWPIDYVGRKLPFSFHGNPCSIWAWHLVIFLFIMTCSLWVQAKLNK